MIDLSDDNKFGAVFMPKTTEITFKEALPGMIVFVAITIGLIVSILHNV